MGSAVVFHHLIFTARVSGVLIDQKMIVGQCPCYIFLCAYIKYIYIYTHTKYTPNIHQICIKIHMIYHHLLSIFIYLHVLYIYSLYIVYTHFAECILSNIKHIGSDGP